MVRSIIDALGNIWRDFQCVKTSSQTKKLGVAQPTSLCQFTRFPQNGGSTLITKYTLVSAYLIHESVAMYVYV